MIIATVPYLNALPLVYYLQNQCVQLHPSQMVDELLNNHIDVALIPVYEVIKHNLRMHPDAGVIGCNGPVHSVGFFTRNYIKDLSDIKSIYFDRESVSSAYLAKVFLKKFTKASDNIETFHYDNRHLADAQLLIGDKALFFDHPKYQYWDLGELWKKETGAGFIFATWASKRTLSEAEIYQLKEAKDLGLKNRDHIVLNYPVEQRQVLKDYLTQNIVYEVNDDLKNGMKLYREYLQECELFNPS
jgi:chorismate dehydratase